MSGGRPKMSCQGNKIHQAVAKELVVGLKIGPKIGKGHSGEYQSCVCVCVCMCVCVCVYVCVCV